MKKFISLMMLVALYACSPKQDTAQQSQSPAEAPGPGQSGVKDPDSALNVVQIASGSADHSTLVVAVKAGELVDALSNAGPFTVFAPTNAAFNKLPAGTVENLLKPENKAKLQDILQYHVYVGVISESIIRDGMKLNQVNGGDVILGKKDGKLTVNGANVLGTIKASNGVIYSIDAVLLPPSK
jgi:uncharacterized surface protein with fasciclin (FAS1) repeats